MFESLLKSMPSILDDLKKEDLRKDDLKKENDVLDKYSVDVTTDEGIKKVRDSVSKAKEKIKYLKENFNDSWFSLVFGENILKDAESSLDIILDGAEKKYKEAHEKKEDSKKSDFKNKYVRPVLCLNSENASNTYALVDKYIETQVSPKLSKNTKPEFLKSVKESLADFAAWIMLYSDDYYNLHADYNDN